MNNSVANAVLSANLIHIPQSADTELVQLAEGHLLRATVQRVADEMALLNFNGKTVMVQTDLPLLPQQRVILQVTQVSAEKVSLQIVQQSPPPVEPGATPPPPPTNLETLLSSFGLDPDPTNQAIAKSLFAHSHTLNPNTIDDVRTIWQQLPALTSLPAESGGKAAALEAVVYLHTHQLPVNSESIALARHLLDNSLPIAQHLNTLQQSLQTLQTSLNQTQTTTTQPQSAANSTPLPNLLTSISTTLSQLSNWSISDKMPPEQIAARLAEVITQLGTPPESQLAHRPELNIMVNGGSERGAATVQNQNGAINPQPATPETAATAQLTVGPRSDSPAGQQSAHQPVTTTQPTLPETVAPLQRLAAAIQETLAVADLDRPTTLALKELASQVATVAKDLGAIQISNLTTPPNPINEPYFMFPIPLQSADGTSHTAHLRVFRRNGSQQAIDPNNLRLALLLDLPELGEIAVNLNVFERHLSGKIISGRAQTHRRVEAGLPELFQGLRKLGYRVDSLTADRLSSRDNSIFEAATPADSIEVPLPQINITA